MRSMSMFTISSWPRHDFEEQVFVNVLSFKNKTKSDLSLILLKLVMQSDRAHVL